MPLYHKEIGFPQRSVKIPAGTYSLVWSEHAKRAASNDRYGSIPMGDTLHTLSCEIVELETNDAGKVTKILYRKKLDSARDLCLAVVPERGILMVKTVWVNLASDNHKTLDVAKYAKPF